jgi:glycosyltransferase involved in cell wall biosynthesis
MAQQNWLFQSVAHSIFKGSSAVTTCSQELRQVAIALGAPENTSLLAWGADPNIFHPALRPLDKYRSFGWKQSDLVIGALGRMVYKKGFTILIKALPEIVSLYPHVKLVIGGDGFLYEEIINEAYRLGISNHVFFMGRIPWNRVQEFLASVDIFVLPSIKDQFGNVDGLPTVLLEAMSCGISVIASDIGGVEMVIENGRNGLLVPPGDIPSLVYAIDFLIENPEKRQELGQAARHAIEEEFNWNSVVHRLIGIFELSLRV